MARYIEPVRTKFIRVTHWDRHPFIMDAMKTSPTPPPLDGHCIICYLDYLGPDNDFVRSELTELLLHEMELREKALNLVKIDKEKAIIKFGEYSTEEAEAYMKKPNVRVYHATIYRPEPIQYLPVDKYHKDTKSGLFILGEVTTKDYGWPKGNETDERKLAD